MTSITQKIPNLIGGISQQPDELMPLGSVRDAVNVIPDVADGLRKRSGSRLINPLLTSKEGSWFHWNYSDNQKYIGKVNYDGTVHVFNVADGLPVNVTYKDWDGSDDSTDAYPDCDPDAVAAAKDAWQKKVDEYNEANRELNDLINLQESISREETDVRLRIERDRSVLEERYFVYEGHVKKNGQDFIIPETNGRGDGWSQRRGDIAKLDGKELRDVTVLVWQVFEDFEGWQRYSPVDVYENVFYRQVTDAVDYSKEIEEKRNEIDVLRQEVNDLYDIYVDEVTKCGYTPEPNIIRGFIDVDVPPLYLNHDLPQQIKTLIVGDTIFFTNPNVAVSMDQGSKVEQRATENYIELTTIAPNKVYTLELVDEQSKGTGYRTVTKASIIDGEYQDEDSSCGYVGTEQEIFNDGAKVNLDLTVTVRGSQYLEGNGNSLSDYVCRYISTVDINNGGANWEVGDVVTMEVSGRKYKIRVDEVEMFYSSKGEYIFPPQTPNGTDAVIRADVILSDLRDAIIDKDSNFVVEIIGNGLYITHNDPDYVFSFATPEGQLMNIVTNEVNSIADLPNQCKGGYVVKIANTDSEYDDYWAKFITEFNGVDGPGTWEETVAPGYNTIINPGSMPHKMVRQANGTFVVSPVNWEPRLVGDDTTNPRPSFVSRRFDQPNNQDLRFINKMAFFRNRLVMMSGDNVVCSRPGDYYNFWKGSALQLVDNDPIDIAVGSTSSSATSTLLDGIEISEGLLTFTENEQHVLSTDSEVFGPRTARFNRIGTYRYNGQVSKVVRDPTQVAGTKVVRGAHAFSMGNSIGFLSDSGLNSRLMEMYNIGRTTEASANELTKPVSRLVPWGINAIADSKDNNIIALGKRDTKDVWVYRYFDNDQQRQQSAWFRWTMLGDMIYHCIMDDVYWHVTIGNSSSPGNAEIVSLQRVDLKDELATAFVEDKYLESSVAGEVDIRDDNGRPFEAHLDNYRIVQPSEFTYYTHLNQTYFRAPLVYYKDEVDAGNLVAYMLSPTIFQRDYEDYGENKTYYFVKIGSSIPVTVEVDSLGTWFVMDGDWSKTRMMIGYQYEMKVELPTLYPIKSSLSGVTRTDTRASLTLHRLKINFGQTGVYHSTIKVRGRNEYTEMYECKTMDEYPANEIAFDQVKTQTIPVYAKNTDTKITISSTHPSPATINSMEWEGDYNSMYYKRV